jgi:DNA repair photolyase
MEYGFQVNVLTKSALVLDDLEMYAGTGRARIGVTVTTPSDDLARIWEPRAAPPSKRFEVLSRAKEAGLATSVMFGPLLPGLSDDAETIERLFAKAAELDVDLIWTDCLNRRPRVWESVRSLVADRYPELFDLYKAILFRREEREEYIRQLGRRIRAAARATGTDDRLSGCP